MIDERPPRLDAYRRKRDPNRTPEPFGGGRPGVGGLFVVQQHAARRLHYDFRLEMDGVLKSWAVPKGPSVHPEVRRLAVHVEDHPLEYADFEGVIPKDNYGAGAVIVWDHGRYRSAKPTPDLLAQLERGLLELDLRGHKLRGRWTLARMGGGAKDWLLIRKAGQPAPDEEVTERYPRSVCSGLTLEEMGNPGAVRDRLRARLRALGAPAREVPAREQGFMLATLAERAPEGPEWLFEIKYDGVRVLAERRGDAVTLLGRSGQVVTGRYPEVVAALRALAFDRFLIDGEIVALDARGVSSFQRLQARMGLTQPGDVARAMRAVPVQAVFFDCLALEGHDLRRVPLAERKACLDRVLPPLGVARFSDHVEGGGPAFLEATQEARLEGIVAKRRTSAYVERRSDAWLKIKCPRRQEFVIGGYTDPQGSRARFGALHVGLYHGGRLVYASKVGGGFDGAALEGLWRRLAPIRREGSPFDAGTPAGRGHHWVEPRLVCEVRFTEWTRDGGLRHPVYQGLRDDLRPEDCRRDSPDLDDWMGDPETPVAEPRTDSVSRNDSAAAAPSAPAPNDTGGAEASASRVRLTNLDKVFWPTEGYTKSDLIRYYEAIAPAMLPYLHDRPIVLTRYPDGITGKSFFQKDAPEFAPDWVRTERVYSKDTDREIDYFVVDDAEMLRYVANMGTIPIHSWSARVPALERPDWLVLDLDPKGAPFTDVVRVAQTVHRLLDELELSSHAKTSGATGLHILVPLGAMYTHAQTRTLARLLAMLVVQEVRDIATVARPLAARGGKVYVDFGQNGHGQTIVAPFSVRPLPGAPVSCPIDWSEVTARLDPARFTIRTVPGRFARRADPLLPVLGAGIELAAALERIERRFHGAAPTRRTLTRTGARPRAPGPAGAESDP
ncbi:MAG TPA: DNA ligase D [Methylomirabilota bacterium]|nr:DNA ligase D [Methylomirabilota bacterium]